MRKQESRTASGLFRRLALLTACCAAGAAHGATLTLTTSDASGKSSFDKWDVSGGGTEAPSAENDYVVSGGRYIRVQWNRTFGGNSLAFGKIGSSAGALIIQRSDSNAGHNIGFGNNGALLNRGYFTIWSQNRTPTLINAGPLTVTAPESEPFRIQLGDGQNTNNAMTISATVTGEAGTALMLCAGTRPQTDSFTLDGDMGAFKGRLIVAGGREQANRNLYPVRAVLVNGKTLGGTLVVQPDASVRAQNTTTTFTTAGLELQEGAILLAQCNNSGTACGKIAITESLSVAPGAIVRLANEPYYTTTNGFDEVLLELPAAKGAIPLENFSLEIATWKFPLGLVTNLVDGVWQLAVRKLPHDLLSTNDSSSTSFVASDTSACTNAASWYGKEAPRPGRMYVAAKGSGGLADYPIIRTPWQNEPYVFPGDALVLASGGCVYLGTSDRTFPLLCPGGNTVLPLSLNRVPSFLRGALLVGTGATDAYPVRMQAYFHGLNTVAADVSGGGVLRVSGRNGSSRPYGDVEFTALNTNFTGRLLVCAAEMGSSAASADTNCHERLFVTDARNLGGPLAAFKADALELAGYAELVPRKDVDLNVANRGVTITGNACFTVPEGVTLTVSNDITYNGALKKKGPGVLALNGNARAGGETASLAVAEGFLCVGSTNALAGVAVTFADGARLLADPTATGDVASFGAVDLSAAPFGGTLPVAFKLPELGEGGTHVYRAVAVCTVASQSAADALAVTAERIEGCRVSFAPRANADGTVTILADIGPNGLSIMIR